ncbi:Hypothetical protein NTJ_04734 [Nesidiocoris tenuis]|uniref:Uncharacterized protein n=1 Tax=Nesidiocoris tenuis TaxID=355587 RepID=A0ABN7AI39_9HEMI|nr:Hypothetical protein NTJ_04734 [Nesidiocoris tenuis]
MLFFEISNGIVSKSKISADGMMPFVNVQSMQMREVLLLKFYPAPEPNGNRSAVSFANIPLFSRSERGDRKAEHTDSTPPPPSILRNESQHDSNRTFA